MPGRDQQRRSLLAVLTCQLLLPTIALAQSIPATPDLQTGDNDPWTGVEEMVVTGEGSSSGLTQASISVAGFDATDLQAIGATDVAGLADFTPNLEIKTAFAASNPTIFIRGVGLDDARANASSSVAVLYDDVYMNSPAGQLAQMFDTEKVDVLRGPQGTFYGRNASAGAIRILSNKPTGERGASVTGTYGRFDHREVEAMLESPIVEDLLAIRMAGRFMQRDGYLENLCSDPDSRSARNRRFTGCAPTVLAQGPAPKKWLNDVDNWAARGIFRFTPSTSGEMEWLLNFHGSQNRGLSTQFQTIGTAGTATNPRTAVPFIDTDNCTEVRLINRRPVCFASYQRPEQGDPYKGAYFRTGKEKLDLFGVSLRGQWTIGNFDLKMISAYEWHDRKADLNIDASPSVSLEPLFTDKAYQLTGDLEIGWHDDRGLSVTLGGFYLYEYLEVFNIFFSGRPVFAPLQDQTQRTRYLGVFGHTRWEISEVLSIEGGIRVNNERKTFQITSSTFSRTTGQRVAANDLDDREEANVTRVSGEATITYTPTPDISFYGKYTRGFKGPHFNGAAVRSIGAIIEPANPETVDAFEFGIKSSWFSDAISLDFATFYYNYKEQQVFQNRSITDAVIVNELINANDTRVAGVEATFRTADIVPLVPFLPVNGLKSSFSFSYLYTEYTNFVNIDTKLITNPLNPVPITISEVSDFSGNQLVSAPEFSFTGDVSYALDVGRYGVLTPRLDYTWRSKVYFTPDNQARLGDRSRWLVNARLSWSIADGKLELAGWVRNLTDEVYRLTALDLIGVLDQINYVMNVPRNYGITATVRF